MADPSPHLYGIEGLRLGHDADIVARAANQRLLLEANNVYPVLSLKHLANLTGAPYKYLRQIIERVHDPYSDIAILKKSGTTRSISAPEPMLMDVQRWILHNIVEHLAVHQASYAYQHNRSIVQCARRHVGARWLIKLDLHNFFGSIPERRVYMTFRNAGYPPLLSLEFARLCTRFQGRRDAGWRPFDKYSVIRSYAVGGPGVLPQGGPTSGALANLIAANLDRQLSKLAAKNGFVYTRYSDDLTFSSFHNFDRSVATNIINQVGDIAHQQKFSVHRKKTRVVSPGSRHIVLGLLLGDNNVHLLPEFKRRIETHVRGVSKFGLTQHANFRGFESIFSFVEHVDGCIAFAAGIDSSFSDSIRIKWRQALIKSGYPVS